MIVTKIELTPEQKARLTTDLTEIPDEPVDLKAENERLKLKLLEFEALETNASRELKVLEEIAEKVKAIKLPNINTALEAENAALKAEVERLRNEAQNTLDLLRTSTPPEAWGMTFEQWNVDKIRKASGELDHALHQDAFITDDCGNYWHSKCPDCGAPMQVVRPGDCRCSAECYTIDDRITREENDMIVTKIELTPEQKARLTTDLTEIPDEPVDLLAEWTKATARVRELEAEVERLKAIVDKLIDEADEETDQFNAGFDAARSGVPYENMPSFEHDHDTWGTGYAWGAFEPLRAEVERLKNFVVAAATKLDSDDARGGLYVLRCALAGEPFRDEDQYTTG